MKKITCLTAVIILAAVFAMSAAKADTRDDLQVIKKAVKENPNYEAGKDAKWFKVLVTDTKVNQDRVRITVPIAIVEVFLKCAGSKHVRMNKHNCDIDVQALFNELKKIGPMSLIEVTEKDEIIKVWLE